MAGTVAAQCNPRWSDQFASPGTSDTIRACAVWDPDGAGPLGPRIAAAGGFAQAGGVPVNGVAAYDPVTRQWAAIGSQSFGIVDCLLGLPNGDLLVAGDFSGSNVQRWDGSAWSAVGTPLDARVRTLAIAPNGDVVAGGDFFVAGTVIASKVARWDGVDWRAYGAGIDPIGSVHDVTFDLAGNLIVTGDFASAGGNPAQHIATWNGTAWSPLGAGLGGPGNALLVRSNGDVCVGGTFATVAGLATAKFARWDGSTWHAYPAVPGFQASGLQAVNAITERASGDLFLAGRLFAGTNENHVLRFDGSALASTGRTITSWGEGSDIATMPAGDTFVVGNFTATNDLPTGRMAQWDGTAWLPVGGDGTTATCTAVAGGATSEAVVAGNFGAIGPVASPHIAHWTGSAWQAMGTGLDNSGGAVEIHDVVRLSSGDYLAGGVFDTAGGVPVGNVARWNGAVWSSLGGGCNGRVRCLHELPNGDVLLGGDFTIAGGTVGLGITRWDGAAFSPVGLGFHPGAAVRDIDHLPNGDIVACGTIQSSGTAALDRVARFDGTAWSPVGTPPTPTTYSLAVLPGGDIVVGTWRVHRWTGSTWVRVGDLQNYFAYEGIYDLEVLPTGELVAGGARMVLPGNVNVGYLVVSDGADWRAFGGGCDGEVRAVAVGDTGSIWAAGELEWCGGLPTGGFGNYSGGRGTAGLARFDPCPGIATTFGTGCMGSGGALTLTPANLPWVGADFTMTTTGMSVGSIGAGVLSFGQSAPVPLATLGVPNAGAGCTFDLAGVGATLLMKPFGSATPTLVLELPPVPALGGVQLFVQGFELEPASSGLVTYTTNAVAFRVGGGY